MDLFHPTPDIEVRESRGSDVNFLATRLRHPDIAEIVAATGEDAILALGRGFIASDPCYTVVFKGEPSAMWGVVRSPLVEFAKLGNVWMLGSTSISLYGKTFHRLSQEWMRHLAKDFDVLACTIDARQGEHLRWLIAIGFRKIAEHPNHGFLGLPFYEMAATMEDLNESS